MIRSVYLTLLSDQNIKHMFLMPENIGRCYFPAEKDTFNCNFLYFEKNADGWKVCCINGASITNSNRASGTDDSAQLEHNGALAIVFKNKDYYLFSEFMEQSSNQFRNYYISDNTSITIGRKSDNDICYNNGYVSSHHAVLTRSSDAWTIEDQHSTNGTYVNKQRVNRTTLNVGDEVNIMRLRLLIGVGFISIDAECDLSLNTNKLRLVNGMTQTGRQVPAQKTRELSTFTRSPRQIKALETEPITFEAPPSPLNADGIPMLLRLGRPAAMGANAIISGNMFMALTSMVFPFLTQGFSEKERKEYEAKRQTKYSEYLRQKRQLMLDESVRESQILNELNPTISTAVGFTGNTKRLWERRNVDDDFLTLRMGTGRIPLVAEVDYPKEQFSLDNDNLEEQMRSIASNPPMVQNAPIVLPLVEYPVCGLLGEREQVLDTVYRMMMQIVMLHSYDEVKLIFLMSQAEYEAMHYIGCLPHVWDNAKTIRFIATDATDVCRISEYLSDELEEIVEKPKELKNHLKEHPYYVLFALNQQLMDSMAVLKKVLLSDTSCGISIVTAFPDMPKECAVQINLAGGSAWNTITYLRNVDKAPDSYIEDTFSRTESLVSLRKLANMQIESVGHGFSLPKTYTFLQMFGVGRVEHLNPLKRWKENNPVRSLTAPVGIGTDGELFYLDLHEKAHGPHGLVAGMTGSGKSEFIISYILSMAVNYHPDEVAFILIDYKGGGLAGAFDDPEMGVHLPHLVGTITNLDGNAIQRSLMSIQSELKRRQAVFNEVRAISGEGSVNIYAYQKLYRAGKVSEPMPHLFIISDEFAELKQQEPEFMEQLISAARIGRSLGVHLILATQRPSGVVNDQILSNTKFRVCLRVQDKSDSQDMLKRPDAAELKDTGRFFLQVGYNEYFAEGQSAWCGADYEPQDEVVVTQDDYVQAIDSTGEVLSSIHPVPVKTKTGIKQIVAIVKHLTEIAEQEHIPERRLWKDPIPAYLPVSEIQKDEAAEATRNIHVTMGMVDDPENQKQFPMVIDLEASSHMLVVGESGSGKSVFLQTMLAQLVRNYSPEDVNFYLLDYSSKLLGIFKNLPHCGAFLTEQDESDISRLFELIVDITNERKRLFEQAGVSSFSAYRRQASLPLILVVIDNYAVFAAIKAANKIVAAMHEYIRNAGAYGISFVLTGSHLNAFSSRVRQEFNTRFALRAKDKYAYLDIINVKPTTLPTESAGRGLMAYDGRALEFQTALAVDEQEEQQRLAVLREELNRIADAPAGSIAKRLTVIKEGETYESFCNQYASGRIPLGYAINTVKPVVLPLRQLYCMSLYFGTKPAISPVFSNILYAGKKSNAEILVFRRKENSVFPAVSMDPCMTIYETTAKNSVMLNNRLKQEIAIRKVYRDEYCRINGIANNQAPGLMKKCAPYIIGRTRPLFIVIESYKDYCIAADESCVVFMPVIYDKGYGYNFYFFAGFEPDDTRTIAASNLYKSFNSEKLIMLFGGKFTQAGLTALPKEYALVTEESTQYNRAVLQYNGKFAPVSMPIGELEKKVVDPDDEPII